MECEKKLDDLHSKHEAYWYLRLRVAEVRDGDRNMMYFHHKASQRKKRDYVKGLLMQIIIGVRMEMGLK